MHKKKFILILCFLLLLLVLIGVLFERDRKFGNTAYNSYYYYITLWPFPIIGFYNTIVRSLNPDHTHVFDVNTFPSNTPSVLQTGWRDIQLEAIDLYEKNLPLLETTGKHWIYANDQIWKEIQAPYTWYGFIKRLGRQRASFSDNSLEFMDRGF